MTQGLLQAAYDESVYTTRRKSGYALVDKTRFIAEIENKTPPYPYICRPSGFGKSFFADMLMAYYDKAAKDDFEKNFSGTWIGEHPTPLANKYLVLRFDFSGLEANALLVENLILKVKEGIQDFSNRYAPNDKDVQAVLDAPYDDASILVREFLSAICYKFNEDIYLIIDGYDRFAQDVFSAAPNHYEVLKKAESSIHSFYVTLKYATKQYIHRAFFSGETSTSLDGMICGFDGAYDLSASSPFAGMLGFTEDELRILITKVVDVERYGHSVDEIFERMKALYAGYRFSQHSEVSVFSSSSCFYYLNEIARTNSEPNVLHDPALPADLLQMESLLSIGPKEYVEDIVFAIVCDKSVKFAGYWRFIDFYPGTLSADDFQTALIFKGFLTFSSKDPDMLVCPNRVIKDLFFKYWFRRMGKVDGLVFPETALEEALKRLAAGDLKTVLTFVRDRLNASTQLDSARPDASVAQKLFPVAVNMALNTVSTYEAVIEDASDDDCTTMLLKPTKACPEAATWLMEWNSVEQSDAKQEAIDAKLAEAQAQLERYSKAENIANIPNLHRAAVVFSGTALKGLKVL